TAACHWVSRGRLKILLDCGAGALHRLAEFGLPWQKVTHVVLSHFHPDHWGELPMLVYALKYATAPPREEPLVILGPPGVVRLVKALAEGYGPWLLDPGFPIGILDIRDGEPFPLDAEVNLETFPVPHTPESVALAVAAPEGRLVYTGDTGPSSKLARWATDAEIQRVVAVIEELGYKASRMPGAQRTAVGLVGNDGRVDASRLEALPGVQEIIHVSKPYKQVSREWKSENTVVRLPGGVAV